MSVSSRKNKSLKKSSRSLKRSKNVKKSKKTRKHIRKMRGGDNDNLQLFEDNQNLYDRLQVGSEIYNVKYDDVGNPIMATKELSMIITNINKNKKDGIIMFECEIPGRQKKHRMSMGDIKNMIQKDEEKEQEERTYEMPYLDKITRYYVKNLADS